MDSPSKPRAKKRTKGNGVWSDNQSAIPGQSFFPHHTTQVHVTHAPSPHRLGATVTHEPMPFSCGPRNWPHGPCSVQRLVQFLGLTDTSSPRRPKRLESSSPPPGTDRLPYSRTRLPRPSSNRPGLTRRSLAMRHGPQKRAYTHDLGTDVYAKPEKSRNKRRKCTEAEGKTRPAQKTELGLRRRPASGAEHSPHYRTTFSLLPAFLNWRRSAPLRSMWDLWSRARV